LGLFGLFLWAGPHPIADLKLAPPIALAFDALLSTGFFLQHSGMIRRSIRARFAAVIPDCYYSVVYAIASGVVLLLLAVLWQPSRLDVLSLNAPLRWLVRGAFFAAMAGMIWAFGSLRFFDPIGSAPLLAHLRARLCRRRPSPSAGRIDGCGIPSTPSSC